MGYQPPIPAPTGEMPPAGNSADMAGIKEIALAQKWLLWSILSGLLIFLLPFLALFTFAFQIWAVCNVGQKLRLTNLWLWVIGTLIPLFGYLVLLRMNSKVNQILQSSGVRIGLMGANMKQFEPGQGVEQR